MRVALILIVMATMTSPSQASPSCMNKSEARHHFGSVHIYWHGSNHCWDATPMTRRRHIARVERQTAERKLQKEQPPHWRDARSEMLAAARPFEPSTESDDPPETTMTRSNWSARWIDVAQVGPVSLPQSLPASIPAASNSKHQAESGAESYGVALIVVGSMLLLIVVVGFMFRPGDTRTGVMFAAVHRRMYS
ncbi:MULTISPECIES: hypothetical protein [unclassified Bradyrhizobium]|uniref:hypothetical protein n=1 Tax=unclassified Bradyrhizobium TaxID=2631580 RepID=UPI002916B3B5|nr:MULTISPECIES: hypothetical protein [unclassified Bradyrhizobium]